MISKLTEIGINLKGRTSGQFKTTCPQCSHTRKKKNDPCLSVDIDNGVWNCHNCGWVGSVNGTHKKPYARPEDVKSTLSDKIKEWFKTRGISEQTLIDFCIGESKEFMPQEGKEMNCINFKYYRGEHLVNIKYRDAKKNFKLVKGAELIFYNLNSIIGAKECIITEGEIDAMSFHEAGYRAVISVPNGASKGSQKLEYIDNCWQYFEGIDRIIIATDSDEPGVALREEIARRLGKERCAIFRYPEGCKDANEILVKGGDPKVLAEYLNFVIDYPIEGVTTVADISNEVDDIFINGYPKGDKIGYYEFDQHLSFRPNELTTVTGIPGSGKSEFIDQIMIRLSVRHGWKWGVWSAENQPTSLHVAKLSEKYIEGKAFYSKDPDFKMSFEEKERAKAFIHEHFYFLTFNDENLGIDAILQKSKELTKKYGIKGFLIDPYNYIDHNIPNGMSETQYISKVLTKIKVNGMVNGLHTILVAHPTKISKKDGVYEVPTLYSISGSAHFFNKTDNGFVVYRDFETNEVRVYIQKVRFKFIGKIGMVEFTYNKTNGTYREKSCQF